MDVYFSALYDQAKALDSSIRILTPPMAQSAYAESFNMNVQPTDACPVFIVTDDQGQQAGSGYDNMMTTHTTKNDGFSWHNYFVQGKEAWDVCPNGQHISLWFPEPMSSNIQYHHRSAIISEADLAPPQMNMGNPITDKDAQPDAAALSIREFLYYDYPVERIAVWLLNDNNLNSPDYPKHAWSQTYSSVSGIRAWFINWWYGSENP